MNEQLKPCPFCGESATMKSTRTISSLRAVSAVVDCHKCGAQISCLDHSDGAVEGKWNTRADGWIEVESAEDLPMLQEVLCWDGCGFSIDYADMDSDSGAHYMANGTEVEAYKLLTPPKAASCGE